MRCSSVKQNKGFIQSSSSSLFLLSAMKEPREEDDVCSVLITVCIVGVRDITLEGCMLMVGVVLARDELLMMLSGDPTVPLPVSEMLPVGVRLPMLCLLEVNVKFDECLFPELNDNLEGMVKVALLWSGLSR